MFWGLRVEGLEHLPPDGPLIVASNHASIADGPILIVASERRRLLRYLTKAEAFSVPVLGWYLRATGMIPVDRSRGDVLAMRSAVEFLRKGGALGVFPEGTRSKDGRPGRPKPGVGFLARESGAAVVPARIRGSEGFTRGRPLRVTFAPPLRFEDLRLQDRGSAGGLPQGKQACQSFAEAVMERVWAL